MKTESCNNLVLEDVSLHKDKNKNYCLSLKYKNTYKDGSVDLITIPSVRLPISKNTLTISSANYITGPSVDCGFGATSIHKGRVKTKKGEIVKDVFWVKERIKDAVPQEMTLDEIEKQLGYKVKIVNKRR